MRLTMMEKQGAGEHVSGVALRLSGLGLATERHKEGTCELLLKECLAIHQTEEGAAGRQKGLRRGKARKTRPPV